MNVTALYFSPTGGSKRSALSLAAAWLLKVLPSWTSPVAPLPGISVPGTSSCSRCPAITAGYRKWPPGVWSRCTATGPPASSASPTATVTMTIPCWNCRTSCLARGAGHQGAASVPGRGQGRGLRAADLRGLYGLRPVRLPVPCAGHRGRPSQHRRHALPFLLPLHPQLPCGGQAHGCGKLPRFRAGFQPAPEGSAGERIHLLEEARKRADAERGGRPPLFFYRGQPPTFLQGGRDSSGRGQ